MSEALYITVQHGRPPNAAYHELWMRADVMLNGESVAHAFAPDFGVYKQEGIAATSAVALAQIQFSKLLCSDIRYKKEVTDSSNTPHDEQLDQAAGDGR
jgi:hypothetical protein